MKAVDLLVTGASQVLTLAGPARPRAGAEACELGVVPGGAVAVDRGVVVETAPMNEILRKYRPKRRLDANGGLVMPGFVDPHTHLVFAGTREREMAMRLAGASYLEILEAGGGIHHTMEATRNATFEELLRMARIRVRHLVEHGTTAVEIKTGYGLEPAAELKMLDVIDRVREEGACDVASTFLGAHVVPKDTAREAYLSWLSGEALESVRGRAEFVDVFCERGAFTAEEAETILRAASMQGFGLKIHAGQFEDLGGAGIAASLGAVSADHLDRVSEPQLREMQQHGTVAVLLPGVPFFLGSDAYPDARVFDAAGVAVSLATDFNPGSCPSYSMPMMVALACLRMHLSPEGAVTASTVNAAWAMGRGRALGSLEPGKQADLVVLNVETPAQIPYFFGVNPVRAVVKRGKVVVGDAVAVTTAHVRSRPGSAGPSAPRGE